MSITIEERIAADLVTFSVPPLKSRKSTLKVRKPTQAELIEAIIKEEELEHSQRIAAAKVELENELVKIFRATLEQMTEDLTAYDSGKLKNPLISTHYTDLGLYMVAPIYSGPPFDGIGVSVTCRSGLRAFKAVNRDKLLADLRDLRKKASQYDKYTRRHELRKKFKKLAKKADDNKTATADKKAISLSQAAEADLEVKTALRALIDKLKAIPDR